MNFGKWEVDIKYDMLPQKIATAFSKVNEQCFGVQYQMIAYLGSQIVNGINHAVLAEQTVLTGKDTKNIVILIFNEKPSEEPVLVSIDRVLESGAPLGGVKIDVSSFENSSEEIKQKWFSAFKGFVGSKITPFVVLGSKVTNGIKTFFVAQVQGVGIETDANKSIASVAFVVINDKEKSVSFTDLLENKYQNTVGYAFTWR